MAYELKPGYGSLFKNKNYVEGGKNPYYTGQINVDGELMDLAAWVKGEEGRKFLSVSIKRKEAKYAQAAKDDTPIPQDDLPF